MDPYEVLDEEIEKLDVKKLLQTFYKLEFEEDYFPMLKAESEKEYSVIEPSIIRDAKSPEQIDFNPEFVSNVKSWMKDQILLVVSDVLRDFLHGFKEGRYRGWREGPNEFCWRGGAHMADPKAKDALIKIMKEIVTEITREATAVANHEGRDIVLADDVEFAGKRFMRQVNIREEDLRRLIREELEKSKI
jgi:histone H3/H4